MNARNAVAPCTLSHAGATRQPDSVPDHLPMGEPACARRPAARTTTERIPREASSLGPAIHPGEISLEDFLKPLRDDAGRGG